MYINNRFASYRVEVSDIVADVATKNNRVYTRKCLENTFKQRTKSMNNNLPIIAKQCDGQLMRYVNCGIPLNIIDGWVEKYEIDKEGKILIGIRVLERKIEILNFCKFNLVGIGSLRESKHNSGIFYVEDDYKLIAVDYSVKDDEEALKNKYF